DRYPVAEDCSPAAAEAASPSLFWWASNLISKSAEAGYPDAWPGPPSSQKYSPIPGSLPQADDWKFLLAYPFHPLYRFLQYNKSLPPLQVSINFIAFYIVFLDYAIIK